MDVFRQFLVWGFGVPDTPTAAHPSGDFQGAVADLAARGDGRLPGPADFRYRRGQDDGIFYVCGCVLAPFGLLVVSGRDDLYPRYFLLIFLFCSSSRPRPGLGLLRRHYSSLG